MISLEESLIQEESFFRKLWNRNQDESFGNTKWVHKKANAIHESNFVKREYYNRSMLFAMLAISGK